MKSEIARFIIAGLTAVAIDLLSYFFLLNYLNPNVSKAISFILGSVAAYLVNKFWTFKQHEKSHTEITKFVCLYLSTLGVNVLVNRLGLYCSSLFNELAIWIKVEKIIGSISSYDVELAIILAFVAATGTSTVLNFIGMKYWVFKKAI